MLERGAANDRGFVLIEALLAIVILGIGVLGIAKLNGVLLRDSGVSKTRAEAVQIAQEQFESIREIVASGGCSGVLQCGCASLANSSETVAGLNANYQVSVNYANPEDASAARDDARWLEAAVTVSWPDDDSDAVNSSVAVTGLVSCLSSRSQAYAAEGKVLSDFLKNSTGRGIVGSKGYEAQEGDVGTTNQVAGTDVADGTTTYESTNRWVQLVNADGLVVLRFEKTGCEQASESDTGFSTISGKVFVQAKNGDPIAAADDLFVISSDASYCATLDYEDGGVLPNGASGSGVEFFYTYYQCYLGPEWWGNVGVIVSETLKPNDRVCVGDPTSADDGTDYSSVPSPSSIRGYRGTLEGAYQTNGIGVVDSGCNYVAQHYSGHNWVLGNNLKDDADCATAETNLNALAPTGSLGLSPGQYFCLSTDDSSCPAIGETGVDPATVVHGQIISADDATLSGIEDTGACTTSSFTGAGPYSYSCDISWAGFAGESWYGAIRFAAAEDPVATLCSRDATAIAMPDGASVAYTINDWNADPDPNAIKFTDVPREVTDVTIDLTVKTDTCGTLGQPDVAWAGSDDPKPIAWPAIVDATGYQVYSCEVDAPDPFAPCTLPGSPTATLSSPCVGDDNDPSVCEPAPEKKDMICLGVKAINALQSSVMSPTKCIARSGNTYSYY